MIWRPEIGLENTGELSIVKIAIYGGEFAGRDFRNHLRLCMSHLNFTLCLVDPEVWMRPNIRSYGQCQYEFALLCADDVLAVGKNTEKVLKELGKYFELTQTLIGMMGLVRFIS